ncbi:hypothetical protein TWF730_008228 [Orbilia blumenaviensis]|uniref:F-box domain-containing protein n=1 Tax=Orbilia blumenaviensis TaxID=1796055 RepID=A0AAV9V4Y1_9PEZI
MNRQNEMLRKKAYSTLPHLQRVAKNKRKWKLAKIQPTSISPSKCMRSQEPTAAAAVVDASDDNLRTDADDKRKLNTTADTLAGGNSTPSSSPSSSTGISSLPVEIHYIILEEHLDARDHGSLAAVCSLWRHIMMTSPIARAKRYIEHSDDRQNIYCASHPVRVPGNFKIHMALRICQSQQFFFKDGSDNMEGCRFGLKGRYAGLTIFQEDPLFIYPEQSYDDLVAEHKDSDHQHQDHTQQTCEDGIDEIELGSLVNHVEEGEEREGEVRGPEEKAAPDNEPTLNDEHRIIFSQSFLYKYQTTGLFPSLLGTGMRRFMNNITLTKFSKVSDYTTALVTRMKELAKQARETRSSELSRTANDQQIISLWERLTATDAQFLFQINNFCLLYGGETLLYLKEDKNQPCESCQNDLFLDHEINLLGLGVLPAARPYSCHPLLISDSDSDSDDERP